MDYQMTSRFLRGITQLLGWVIQLTILLFSLNFAYQLAKRRLENTTGRHEKFGNVLEHYMNKIAKGAASAQKQTDAYLPALIAAKDSATSWLGSVVPPKPVTAPVAKQRPRRHAELQDQIRQLQEQVHGHQEQAHQLRWARDQLEEDHQTQNAELEEALALERADLARFYEGVLASQRHELQQAAVQQAAADGARIRDLQAQLQDDHEALSSAEAGDGSSLLAALKEQRKETRELQRALADAHAQQQDGDHQRTALRAERDGLDAARARAEDQACTAQTENARRRLQVRCLRATCVRLRTELRAEQERLGRGYMAEVADGYVPMEGVVV